VVAVSFYSFLVLVFNIRTLYDEWLFYL
jgi:hypothetical protein